MAYEGMKEGIKSVSCGGHTCLKTVKVNAGFRLERTGRV